MTAKQAAAAARAKKDAEQLRECMASTYRQFRFACDGRVPVGNYYDMFEEDKDPWRKEAKEAAVTLGLRPTTEPKEG